MLSMRIVAKAGELVAEWQSPDSNLDASLTCWLEIMLAHYLAERSAPEEISGPQFNDESTYRLGGHRELYLHRTRELHEEALSPHNHHG